MSEAEPGTATARGAAWLDDDQQAAWRSLLSMTSHLQAHLNRRLHEQSGLSLADYDVLVPLSEDPAGRKRMFALAADLGWDRSRLSHQLARMQQRGLVARQDCPTDRRGAFVVITEMGRGAVAAAAPSHVAAVREVVFDGLEPAQVDALRAITEAVLHSLDRSAFD